MSEIIVQHTVSDAVNEEKVEETQGIPYLEESIFASLNHPDDDEFESEEPIGASNHHVLHQIHLKGSYKSAVTFDEDGGVSSKKILDLNDLHPTTRLDVTFSVTAITVIDHESETFQVKIRLFAFWKVDLHAIGMEDIAQRARVSGHYCHMKRNEIERFAELSAMPVFHAMNAVEMDDSELPDIRVYGGEKGETAVLWNKGYCLTCKAHFEFQNFPFDHQELKIQLRLNDLRQWELFNLSVSTVQFHKQALQHSEWTFCEPIVARNTPPTAGTDIKLQMRRHPGYYIQNIVMIMSGLVALTLLVFALEVEEVGIRLLAVFTIILNAVAFKLFYSTLLPKVSYNTILDYYIFENFALLGLMALFSVVPFFYHHDKDYAETLNFAMLALSAFLIAVNLVKFFLNAWFLSWSSRSSGRHTKEIVLLEDKNWYSYRYAMPHYLPAIKKDT